MSRTYGAAAADALLGELISVLSTPKSLVGRSFGQLVGLLVGRSFEQLAGLLVSPSVGWTICGSAFRSVLRSVGWTVCGSAAPSIGCSVGCMDRPSNQQSDRQNPPLCL